MDSQYRGFLCLLDESKVGEKSEDPFLAYGGLLVPLEHLPRLDHWVSYLRQSEGYPPDVPLKWTDPGAGVPHERHAAAKGRILQECRGSGCLLFVSLTHSKIAAGAAEKDEALTYGANTTLRAVHEHLDAVDGRALVMVDKFPGRNLNEWLDQKGTLGLVYPGRTAGEARTVALPRMMGFASTSAKASRIGSLLDVALGCLAYCLAPDQNAKAVELAPSVTCLVCCDAGGSVFGRGINLYPTDKRVAEYFEAYRRMVEILARYGFTGGPTFSP